MEEEAGAERPTSPFRDEMRVMQDFWGAANFDPDVDSDASDGREGDSEGVDLDERFRSLVPEVEAKCKGMCASSGRRFECKRTPGFVRRIVSVKDELATTQEEVDKRRAERMERKRLREAERSGRRKKRR